jgi:hypothetical protein
MTGLKSSRKPSIRLCEWTPSRIGEVAALARDRCPDGRPVCPVRLHTAAPLRASAGGCGYPREWTFSGAFKSLVPWTSCLRRGSSSRSKFSGPQA